ncbi:MULTISPECIES: hypothetical protein [Vibrio]|jgi:hypothetical protein|uniref:hypothetical protein n=1 Tax=Vibrio TaxID=662 RepID=UPI00354D473B
MNTQDAIEFIFIMQIGVKHPNFAEALKTVKQAVNALELDVNNEEDEEYQQLKQWETTH